jgi:hypothetical protein
LNFVEPVAFANAEIAIHIRFSTRQRGRSSMKESELKVDGNDCHCQFKEMQMRKLLALPFIMLVGTISVADADLPATAQDYLDYCAREWTEDCNVEIASSIVAAEMVFGADRFCPPPIGGKPDNHEVFQMITAWAENNQDLLTSRRSDLIGSALFELFKCP